MWFGYREQETRRRGEFAAVIANQTEGHFPFFSALLQIGAKEK